MSKIDVNFEYNPAFYPLIDCDTRYLVLYGGAGSGKSVFVAMKIIEDMLEKTLFNLLVVRNTGRTNRDSTFALLRQVITSHNLSELFTINQADMRIKCVNNNEIIFSGLDDVEKLKSITFSNGELTTIWIEEASEILESDFNQLDVRLRGGDSKKQIIITFNPVDINHWLHRFIESDREMTVHHSTYKDNHFLDADYSRLLESYKDTDSYYYNVYCLGNWGVLGNTIFDAQKISERMAHLPLVLRQGLFNYSKTGDYITDYFFCDEDNGYIKIYKEPVPDHRYVIGGDTAGEGSDYFIDNVVDFETGEQVAVLRTQMDADLYAKQTYCLGMYYNEALLCIEANFDSYPLRELERLDYRNLYVREVQDTFTGAVKKAFGFRTDSVSRPRIISQLVEIVREHTDYFNDKTTLEEMLTFVRNEKGRAEAQNGSHDDLVMACAITYEAFSQVKPKRKKIKRDSDEESFFNYGG